MACGRMTGETMGDKEDEPKVSLNGDEKDIQIQDNDNSFYPDNNNNSVAFLVDSKEISKIEEKVLKTGEVRNKSKYWKKVVAWDEENLRTGVDRVFEPLLNSESQYYSVIDLEGFPKTILYLAKNEIYA